MAGEASDILRLHDDTLADKLSVTKIFYRNRLVLLEGKNNELEKELSKYRRDEQKKPKVYRNEEKKDRKPPKAKPEMTV